MIRICAFALFVLTVCLPQAVHAQPFTFNRVEPREVDASIYGVKFLNGRAWTIQLGTVGYWENGEQTTVIPTRKTWTSASDISPSGGLWVLNEGREVTFCTRSGEELVQTDIFPILYSSALAALDDDSCLIARSSFTRSEIYVYRVSRTKQMRIDTFDIDSVESLSFQRNPISNELILCMRHSVLGGDTSTLRYHYPTGTFTPSPLKILPTKAIDANGTEYRIRNNQITVRQGSSDVETVLVDSVASLAVPERLVGYTNGRLYGTRLLLSNSISFMESQDEGKTFREIAKRDLVSSPILDHSAWFDSSIAFADYSHELLLVTFDGELTVVGALPVSSTEIFTEASTIPGKSSMVALAGEDSFVTYDAAADLWAPLVWVHGNDVVKPEGLTLTRSYRSLYATTTTNSYRYDPGLNVMKQILTTTGRALPNMRGVASTSSDLDLLNFTGLWYRSDGDSVSPHATDWNQGLQFGATLDWIGHGVVLASGDLLAPSAATFTADGDTLATAVGSAGVRRSTDQGVTWTPANEGLGTDQSIWSLHVDTEGTVYALASHNFDGNITVGRLYKSADNGHTWQSTLGFFPSSIGNPVKLTLAEDRLYLCGPSLIMSTSAGEVWTSIEGPWGSARVNDVVELRRRRLLVLTSLGVYITEAPVSVGESEAPSRSISVKGLTARYHRGVLTVERDAESSGGSVHVYDLAGRMVVSVPGESVQWVEGRGEVQVHIAHGTYIVQASGLAATIVVAE